MVDATDVYRGIFQVREVIPVRPGRMTLLYPRWVPGNHAATAPLNRFAGLTIRGGGRIIPWKRNRVDPHAFHIDVPVGVNQIDLHYQYLGSTSPDQGRVVTTPEMLNLQWFSMTVFPAGHYARRIMVEPSVTFPEGWKFSTQLALSRQSGSTAFFKPVNVEVLLDSPIFAGRHFKRWDLGSIAGAPVMLDTYADQPEYLKPSNEGLEAHRKLVEQTGKLFGAPPFSRYTFLFALTRELGSIGTEHLASSENSSIPEYFTGWAENHAYRGILPHELIHAWNGKARRPADLWTPDFNQPMQNSLLWLYEGQTSLWGIVLAARSGLMTKDQVMGWLARYASVDGQKPGRAWRPLTDTQNDPVIDYDGNVPWPSWQRSANDFYAEGALLWLELDGLIRKLSGERRSLDDFARIFFAGGGEQPSLYTFDDVVAALNRVQPYDWSTYLRVRLESTTPETPSDWMQHSGYRLAFDETPTEHFSAFERRFGVVDLTNSIGLLLAAGTTGSVFEVLWEGPAFNAEITPGSTIISVNGLSYSPDGLKAAIQANRGGERPIELVVKNRNRIRTVRLDYRDGLKYPRLLRAEGTPDRLTALLTAK